MKPKKSIIEPRANIDRFICLRRSLGNVKTPIKDFITHGQGVKILKRREKKSNRED